MFERISFNLSRGYLSKARLTKKKEEMDQGIIDRILSELSILDSDKIECYHGCLISGPFDRGISFDYLILYKFHIGFKPIVVKNGKYLGCYPSELFEDFYEEVLHYDEYTKRFDEYDESEWDELEKSIKEIEHKCFGHANYKVDELLELICESSREKFHKFLEAKYSSIIRQDVLLF